MAADPLALIFVICLGLGLLSGIIMHRSDYCIAGMFRDLFLFRRTVMLRTLCLLIISSMVLFEAARQLGLLPLYPFPLLYSPTPANVIGGFLFGVGMVLAGGCVVGTLYKMGSGSLLSAVTFAGLIIGSAFYAEIHPLWASFIKQTTFFQGKITIPQILGINPFPPVTLIVACGVFFLFRWHKAGLLVRDSQVHRYLQPWKAAVYLSVIGLVSYLLIGMPMGVTTSYAKIAGFAEGLFFREHLDGLAYFKAVPLKFVHPLTGAKLQGGGAPLFDAIAAIQFPLVIGIILGSAASAISLREFRIYYNLPPRQYVSALAGGIIMGMASRMAPTCNVWHLLGGIPILAASSLLFLSGLIPGAWAGSMIFVHKVMKT
ncbi:MAG: YeeE/YedE family protein [Nitrospirae bacterium]|nr:YeeE/YedE family protein [Nitrospirota bacterium]